MRFSSVYQAAYENAYAAVFAFKRHTGFARHMARRPNSALVAAARIYKGRNVCGAVLGLAFALVFAPAAADSVTFLNYASCVKLVQANPGKALAEARDWADTGGGYAAAHCVALAYSGLKQYPKAAAGFEALAKRSDIGDFRARAALWDQSGNAWMLAGNAKNANQAFTTALALTPGDIDILTDRARARAMLKDWYGADADLSAALQIDQKRVDLLVLRASARRALVHKADAATDILRALTLRPNDPGALVERGSMKYEIDDWYGARNDWQKAARGKGESALAAKRLLAGMGPAPKPIGAK